MVSPTAIADIKAAISSGVNFKPEEIIRLNALGLRYDYSKSNADMRIMPRVAWLGDVAFREPTIGHEIWMFDVAEIFDMDNAETRVKVRAYCLATPPLELPPMTDGILNIKKKVQDFCRKKISQWTLGQVACALMFAENGDVQTAGEFPEAKKESKRKKTKPVKEGDHCYEVGLLRNGMLLNLGTPDKLIGMTVSGLETLIIEKMKLDQRIGAEYAKDIVNSAFGDYKRTLESILAEHAKNNEKKD